MMRRRRWMWEMAAVVAFLATPAACLAAEPIKLGALLETSAIIDTVQRARVPLMANGASRGIVLPPDQKRGVFLAPLTDVLVQGRMLDHMKKRGITKIALLNSDVAFGTSGREQLERLAPAAGIRVVTQQT